MAGYTGPISTLPGSWHETPKDMKCDQHHDREAIKRLQGETDSFGSEMLDMCTECVEEYEKGKETDHIGACDWCKKVDIKIIPTRDLDEGSTGPIYYVCGECRSKKEEEARKELEESGYYDQ